AREGSGEAQESGLRHLAFLPANFDKPVCANPANRVATPRAVVHIEEQSEDVLAGGGGTLRRTDVHADGPSRVGDGAGVGHRPVQPVVRSAGEPVSVIPSPSESP